MYDIEFTSDALEDLKYFKKFEQQKIVSGIERIYESSYHSSQRKFLFDLLMKVREEGLILQTTNGQQFALMPLTEWQSYTVGDSDDFAEEVKATAENDDLMALLATRRSDPKRISIEDVKKELGLL